MIDKAALWSVVETYEKYGWRLRRIVDSVPGSGVDLTSFGVPVASGIVDAAWFSRGPAAAAIAWEVRYLGPTPYALVEHLDENSVDFEQMLHQTEQRLADAVAAKGTA